MYCKLSCDDSLLFNVVSYVDKTSFMATVILYSLINNEDLCCNYCNMFSGQPCGNAACASCSSCLLQYKVYCTRKTPAAIPPQRLGGGVIGQPKLYKSLVTAAGIADTCLHCTMYTRSSISPQILQSTGLFGGHIIGRDKVRCFLLKKLLDYFTNTEWRQNASLPSQLFKNK